MRRARDLGIPFEGTTGIYNAITDIPGVTVGYATVIEGESARTGVTIIHPRGQRTGALGGNGSGDIFLAFSTASTGITQEPIANVKYLVNDHLDPLFSASAYAAEEAIINSMVSGKTMTGHRGMTVEALPHDKLIEIMRQYNRI